MLPKMYKHHILKCRNLTYSFFRTNVKKYCSNQAQSQLVKENENAFATDLSKLIEKHGSKILYSSFIEEEGRKLGLQRHKHAYITRDHRFKKGAAVEAENEEPLPYCLKYFTDVNVNVRTERTSEPEQRIVHLPHFPFRDSSHVTKSDNHHVGQVNDGTGSHADSIAREIRYRQQSYSSQNVQNWMMDYENYDDRAKDEDREDWRINYGTPDSRSRISQVPCGGCGALLHCKDTAIPGYIPSEIYRSCKLEGGVPLKALVCQRCHFLKEYNLALQARVSPEDYPKILSTIGQQLSIVVLMVDLLDFPCSIWPGIADIFWNNPIVIVGNKVDLLPQDSENFLKHVKNVLLESVKLAGFGSTNIQSVELVSSKTGFGIEELVTRLQSLWKYTGNFYIVGCTNVGKSSLFNILLQTDFCKVQASDLIQRATTSLWPGTTLNLLKFPITRPTGWRLHLRMERLGSTKKLVEMEKRFRKEQLKSTGDSEYATLIGHLGRTFPNPNSNKETPSQDGFDVSKSNLNDKSSIGIDERANDFKYSRWCYDTPGVVQPDQIIHLLTTEELMLTLPKEILKPKTFSLRADSTIFIGGLARLDFLEGIGYIRFTAFCSDALPITICHLNCADAIYEDFLGTEIFRVPTKEPERLAKWPKLVPTKDLKIKGVHFSTACADVVLSSAGWVSVTGRYRSEYVLKAWTPEGRGAHLRSPLLPNAVNLRGTKIRGSPAYGGGKFFFNK